MSDFRDLHYGERPLLLPNAWDFASGAALAEAGFAAVGTTSLGVAAAAGKPDATGDTRAETLALARNLARLPVPVTVDIEGGYSEDPGEVAALVAELESYGIAGVNLEDGRSGGTLVEAERHAAVVEAVKAAAPGVFLNARTDTFWLGGDSPDLDETLRRIALYDAAGADGVFVPGLAEDADVRAVLDAVEVPLNVLYLPGRTPYERMAELGVHRVSLGSLLFRAALGTAVATALGIAPGPVAAEPAAPYSYADVQRMVSAAAP